MRRARRHSGFTVLEILIVLAIAAGMFYLLGVGFRKVRNTYLREDTSHVAAALRVAYNLSAQTGKHHRVMFDLKEQTFQVQACEGKVLLHRERREFVVEDPEKVKEELERAHEKLTGPPAGAGGMGGGAGMDALGMSMGAAEDPTDPQEAMARAAALAGQRIGTAECHPVTKPDGSEDRRGEVRKIQTWRDIEIQRIYVQHLEDPVEDDIVSINFFPMGYAEKAVVVMSDSDGDKYTLLVHGLTGRVEFRDGEWRKPDEHMMRDGAGDTVEER